MWKRSEVDAQGLFSPVSWLYVWRRWTLRREGVACYAKAAAGACNVYSVTTACFPNLNKCFLFSFISW